MNTNIKLNQVNSGKEVFWQLSNAFFISEDNVYPINCPIHLFINYLNLKKNEK
jgi:hypothetical protein